MKMMDEKMHLSLSRNHADLRWSIGMIIFDPSTILRDSCILPKRGLFPKRAFSSVGFVIPRSNGIDVGFSCVR